MSSISRGHHVHRLDGPVPQFCMVGGKWTTFRAFAEQAADAVLAELGRGRVQDTIGLPIGGGAGFSNDGRPLVDELTELLGIGVDRPRHLVAAYGTRADEVLAFCKSRDDDVRLDAATEVTSAEIVFLIRREFAVRLSDLLLRRTALAIRGEISMAQIERVGDLLEAEIGLDPSARAREVENFIEELDRYHGVSRETLEQRTKNRSLTCA